MHIYIQVAFLTDERDALVQDNAELKSTSKHQLQQMSIKDDQIKALQHSSSVLQQDLDQVMFVHLVYNVCMHEGPDQGTATYQHCVAVRS